MNSIVKSYYPMFRLYQQLRDQLVESLEDGDLAFQPGGENPTLGALCLEIGEVQHAYIQSFKTFQLDFSYRNMEAGLETSVDRLTSWFAVLDGELQAAVEELSEEDITQRVIDRGHGFVVPPQIQLDIYKEALLIFYGKASVYLKAMAKPRSHQWQEWIA